MFKRRLAVLGAVGVLALSVLGGSALADDAPPANETKVTCTTADGKVVEFKAIKAAELVAAPQPGQEGTVTTVNPDVKVDETVERAPFEATEMVPAQPAVPAQPLNDASAPPMDLTLPDGAAGEIKAVTIACKAG
ncbi:hypothetical protein HII36_06975 [Nonomuraea sp. NN258]|uniref:hypothetical protein n=1 Tax=Nonomuraea antri TaxID=2730852 RepID=UPI0015685E70|nr:hypothetical protein [Nonomuraea antri]NRQ31585.1 hypothetical protein [Nonomuraea antri]